MTDKLYTPVNCKLVVELVAKHFPEFSRNFIGGTDEWLSNYFSNIKSATELIREALAKDGVSVLQGYRHRNGYLDLAWKCGGERIYLRQPWSFRNDPTARHALFAATVEYLEVK